MSSETVDRFTATEHARLSPSSAERWLNCPGSVRLSAQSATGVHSDSPYAWEGTLAHRVAEILAARHFGLIKKAKYKERLLHWRDLTEAGGYDPDEMIRYGMDYVELLQSFMDEHDGHEGLSIYLEIRVDPGIPASGGTADAAIVCLECCHVHIIDYKYGRGVAVFAEDNPQLKIYGLGVLEELGDSVTSSVCMTVHQPRLESVSHSCVDADELRLWRDIVVIPAARLALSQDAYLQPSETACRWCPVAGECSARTTYMTRRDFGNPELLSPEELAEILAVLPDIEDWAAQVKDTALRRAYHDGVEIPGYKVVMSSGRRSITDHEAALKKLAKAGYDESQTARITTKTLGDLERLVGGRQKLDKILGPTVAKGPGKESLVEIEDDDRPAISALSVAQADFTPVEK